MITSEHWQDQPTLVPRYHPDPQATSLFQAGVVASSFDNLFHPVTNPPYEFSSPNVPRYHAYNSSNTFQRPLPYRSPFSSYNKPHFIVPPLPHALYNHIPPLAIDVPLGSPPPVPPRNLSHFVSFNSQTQLDCFSEPAYNFSQPAMHQFPTVYHNPLLHVFPPSPSVSPVSSVLVTFLSGTTVFHV